MRPTLLSCVLLLAGCAGPVAQASSTLAASAHANRADEPGAPARRAVAVLTEPASPAPPPLLERTRPVGAVAPRAGEPAFPLSVGDDETTARRRRGPSATEEVVGTLVVLTAAFADGCALAPGAHRADAHAPPCPPRRTLAASLEGGKVVYVEWREP